MKLQRWVCFLLCACVEDRNLGRETIPLNRTCGLQRFELMGHWAAGTVPLATFLIILRWFLIQIA